MKALLAFVKKEYLEAARTGKITLLVLLFGIMNPAMAKLTPWMMEMFSDTLEENGLLIIDIQVDAMTSWTQFYKNLPIALIAYVLIFSDLFTKEYRSGTLLLVLTKGLARYKVVLSKNVLLLFGWTLGYGLCFAITYGYNAYFWDNGIADHLFASAAVWWLFGTWVICLMVLFSSLLQSNTSVSLCVGGTVLLSYLLGMIPKAAAYFPTLLMNAGSLLNGIDGINTYQKAVIAAVLLCIVCVAASIPIMNRKQL